MQTFLPYSSFVKSAECLDVSRLGKQRVEAGQILQILLNKPILPKNINLVPAFQRVGHAWERHPAVLMWKGHEEWLKNYLDCCIGEWESRGYRNTIVVPPYFTEAQSPPKWLGHEPFHVSHRSNLVRKKPEHYKQFWPNQNPNLSYFWPTKEGF